MRLAHVCLRYSRCGHVYTKSSDNILICAQYMILVGIIRASLVIVLLLLASFYRDNRTAAQYLCAGAIVVVVLETVVCMYDHARGTIHKEDLPHSGSSKYHRHAEHDMRHYSPMGQSMDAPGVRMGGEGTAGGTLTVPEYTQNEWGALVNTNTAGNKSGIFMVGNNTLLHTCTTDTQDKWNLKDPSATSGIKGDSGRNVYAYKIDTGLWAIFTEFATNKFNKFPKYYIYNNNDAAKYIYDKIKATEGRVMTGAMECKQIIYDKTCTKWLYKPEDKKQIIMPTQFLAYLLKNTTSDRYKLGNPIHVSTHFEYIGLDVKVGSLITTRAYMREVIPGHPLVVFLSTTSDRIYVIGPDHDGIINAINEYAKSEDRHDTTRRIDRFVHFNTHIPPYVR